MISLLLFLTFVTTTFCCLERGSVCVDVSDCCVHPNTHHTPTCRISRPLNNTMTCNDMPIFCFVFGEILNTTNGQCERKRLTPTPTPVPTSTPVPTLVPTPTMESEPQSVLDQTPTPTPTPISTGLMIFVFIIIGIVILCIAGMLIYASYRIRYTRHHSRKMKK